MPPSTRAALDTTLRHQRALRRMAGGSLDGRVEVAAPTPSRPKAERFIPAPSGATGRIAAVLVAADDAPDAIKAIADYVCDGTDDQAEINLAIDAAESDGYGVVELSAGTFTCSDEIVFSAGNVWLRGAGRDVTTIIGDAVESVIDLGGNFRITLSDFTATGNGLADFVVNVDFSANVFLERLALFGATVATVNALRNDSSLMDNVTIQGCRIYGAGIAIRFATTSSGQVEDVLILGNVIEGDVLIKTGSGQHGDGIVLADNLFRGDIELQNQGYVLVSGNTGYSATLTITELGSGVLNYSIIVTDNYFYDGAGNGGSIRITNADLVTVANNTLDYGGLALTTVNNFSVTGTVSYGAAKLTSCNRGAVAGNQFAGDDAIDGPVVNLTSCRSVTVGANELEYNENHASFLEAIRLDASDDCLVDGNNVQCNITSADVNGGAILITNGSDRNKVSGNMVRVRSTRQWQYGVRIDSGCNDNLVIDNDAFGAWTVSAISDAGTGTVTTSANR